MLNHKYTGENALRSSGLQYTIIRPTGLTNESEGGPFLLEASQGGWVDGFAGVWVAVQGGWVGWYPG